jgi:hypothetical protein
MIERKNMRTTFSAVSVVSKCHSKQRLNTTTVFGSKIEPNGSRNRRPTPLIEESTISHDLKLVCSSPMLIMPHKL